MCLCQKADPLLQGAATSSTAAASFRETTLSPDDTVIENALHLLCYYFLGAKNKSSHATSLSDLMREYSFNQIAPTDMTMVLKRFLVDGNQIPPYLTDDQRAKSGDVTTLNARTKNQLVNMYLRVLELIKAILVRMCREDGESASSAESITAHTLVMRAWSLVLGQLDCIRCVLVHGHDRGFIDLGPYPREWSVIIEETVGYIHECAERVRRVEQTAIPLQQDEFEYQVAMDDVRKRFDARIQALHAAQAERIRLQQELERSLKPELWLKRYNVGDTEKILSSGSTAFARAAASSVDE